ncbi:hypothetical protein C8R48DRAFT_759142 [Suillus tomentosus]|nr:hypothetical protein C8R48DRAFT_759142 [Suillus tomentosus]
MMSARSLQFATFSVHGYNMGMLILIYPRPLSNSFIQTYDYACSFHEEWTFLLRSHWGKMKIMYIVTRYLPFIILAIDLYMSFAPNENPAKCRVLQNINPGLDLVLVIFSECFFILRTYALWNRNRFLLVAMLLTLFLVVDVSARLFSEPPLALLSPLPFLQHMRLAQSRESQGATGVRPITGSLYHSFSFLYSNWVLFPGLMILTLIPAIQSWRTNSNGLYAVLVNHNISYYACGLVFSAANIFTSLLLDYSYHSVFYDFEFMILAILATRMHLHLWKTNRHPHDSTSALMHVPMSDMSFANHSV